MNFCHLKSRRAINYDKPPKQKSKVDMDVHAHQRSVRYRTPVYSSERCQKLSPKDDPHSASSCESVQTLRDSDVYSLETKLWQSVGVLPISVETKSDVEDITSQDEERSKGLSPKRAAYVLRDTVSEMLESKPLKKEKAVDQYDDRTSCHS